MKFYSIIILMVIFNIWSKNVPGQTGYFKIGSQFHAPEARQGVAVDEYYIYVIGSQQIAKYDKATHKMVKKWIGDENGPIIHLDSGVIINGKLYCAHSNYPAVPMTSSVEIWDAETLEHYDSHSFGINWGSCTWIDKFNDGWYVGFAHYNKWKHITGKGSEWTVVVKFNEDWNFEESWIFPDTIVTKFGNMSNSGASFGPDGYLYCTGHDSSEVYVMDFPEKGSTLELVEIIQINIFGQGIAWDRSQNNVMYGIRKKPREVVSFELIEK
ncbi:cycloisomerase [Bacteroidota bacterium]